MKLWGFFLYYTVHVLFFCTNRSSGQTYDNMTTLLSTVLSGYNSDVRPVQAQSSAVNVNLSLYLYNVLEVDTVQGVLTLTMALPCTWYDEKITWNSSDYGGIDSIKIQQQYVWTPGLVSSKPVEFTSTGQKWMHVNYQSNGSASWSPAGVYQLACSMNIRHWPFDEQQCELTYFAYDYTDSEVQLHPGQIYTAFLAENGEWNLESISISTLHRYGATEVAFTLTLKRRVLFYTATLVIPLVFLSSLSCFVFLLPSESGERVGYCITILLSMTVFLDVISDEVPKLSNPIPVLCQFILLGIIVDALITVLVVLNLWLYHRSDKVPIGIFYKFVVKLARCKRTNSIGVEYNQQGQNELFKKTTMGEFMHKGKDLLGKTKQDSDTGKDNNNVETLGGDKQEEECDVTWHDVSIAFDRVCLVILGMATAVCVPVMMLILTLRL